MRILFLPPKIFHLEGQTIINANVTVRPRIQKKVNTFIIFSMLLAIVKTYTVEDCGLFILVLDRVCRDTKLVEL